MAIFVEDYFPVIKNEGLNTAKNVSFGGTLAVTGIATMTAVAISASGTATTAGGATGISMGTASAMRICWGSGVPTLTAPQGSLYLRTDGSSTSTRAYINTDGATTWTAITTAA